MIPKESYEPVSLLLSITSIASRKNSEAARDPSVRILMTPAALSMHDVFNLAG